MPGHGVSPARVLENLRGMSFPCSRTDLLSHARRMGAPDDVLNLIQSLPDRRYNSMADVTAAIGEVE